MPTIKLLFPANGGPATIDVEGCAGESCKLLTEGLERRLGKVVSDTPKPELEGEQEVSA